jgi:hypothetical protein
MLIVNEKSVLEAAELSASSVPKDIPQPDRKLSDETLLCSLERPVSVPTLVLSDLSSNYKALWRAVKQRGFVCQDREGSWKATHLGLASRVVLLGDICDRRSTFMETVALVHYLRELGIEVRTVIGNHEAFLLSFLGASVPQEIDVSELHLQHAGAGELITTLPLLEFAWGRALNLWLRSNGGQLTLLSLLDCVSGSGRGAGLEPLPESYGSEAARIVGKLEDFEKARWTFLNSTFCKEFVRQLEPFVVDNGTIFVHAAVPAVPEHVRTKEDPSLAPLSFIETLFRETLTDPGRLWCLGPGFMYFPTEYATAERSRMNDRVTSEHYRGPLGDLIWARLPEVEYYSTKGAVPNELYPVALQQAWLTVLRDKLGVQAICRGHDSNTALGEQGQSVRTRLGITIMNCDVELCRAGHRGYTFFSPDGQVFAKHTSSRRT